MPIANTCSIGYPHDGRADNAANRHDRRADNAAYRHDRRADSLSLNKYKLIKMPSNYWFFIIIRKKTLFLSICDKSVATLISSCGENMTHAL